MREIISVFSTGFFPFCFYTAAGQQGQPVCFSFSFVETVKHEWEVNLSSVRLLAAPLAEVDHASFLQLGFQLHIQRPLVENPLNFHLTVPGQLQTDRQTDKCVHVFINVKRERASVIFTARAS